MVKLTLERGGARESFPLGEEAITIGRSPGNTIVIDDTASSRRHCRIDPVATGFELLDLESQNGTKVNGKTVKRHTLASGDRIEIGTHVFTFTTADDDGVEVEEVEIEGEVDAMAIFLVFEGGPHDADRIDLTVGTHVVGRKKASGVDIAIDDASVSTKHAEIRIAGDEDTALAAGAVTIKDLGSTNGTFKNGARVSEAELRHGDQIRFGSVKLRFSDARSGGDIPEVTILKGDEAEGAKRSMVPSVALLALLLVAGGAAAYFALRPDRSGVKPAGAPPAGSLIRDGWSFEEPESANLWVAERGTASPADGAAKSGAFALRVTAAGSEGSSGRGIATYDPYLAVRAGATYRVSAAVAQSGGSGVGGILVRYYDRSGAHPDEPLWLAGTEFVPLAPGFRAVEALVSAPSSMNVSHARVSCVAFGSGVRALFDDVVFAPAEGGGGAPSLALDSFALDVGRGGSLTLRRGNVAWLESFECTGTKSGTGTLEAALLARSPAASSIEGGVRFEAALGMPGVPEESSSGKLVVEARAGPDDPGYHVRVQGPTAAAAGLDSLALEATLGEPLASHPVVLVTESAVRAVNGDAATSDVAGVVLGAGDDRIRIKGAGATPLRVAVATSGGRTRLRFEPAAGAPLALEFDIQVSFTAERGQAKSLSIEAEQAERDGRFGDAIARYRSILKDFPFNEKVTEAADVRVKELEARVDKEVARIGAALAEAQFFGMAPLLERVKRDAESAARTYSGTKGAADATEIAGKAASALEAISKASVEARAEGQLAKGRDLLTSGSKALASIVLRDVVARYAGTKAAEQAKSALAESEH